MQQQSISLDRKIRIICEDITTLHVDAIVNAANNSLLGGGGVDGAIHRAAGPALLGECRKLKGCKTGEAKMTNGYDLPATYIIHTVGPIYQGGESGEADLLAACYANSLKLAQEKGVRSIAFPCISTGVYHYPKEEAADIALNEIRKFLQSSDSSIETVYIVCFGQVAFDIYKRKLALLSAQR